MRLQKTDVNQCRSSEAFAGAADLELMCCSWAVSTALSGGVGPDLHLRP